MLLLDKETSHKREFGIDFFRIIGSFLVVVRHARIEHLPYEYILHTRLLETCVVPFFFLTSGYFLGQKFAPNNITLHAISKAFQKITWAHIINMLVFGIILIIFIKDLSFKDVYRRLGYLWFLRALLIGYATIYIANRIKKQWILIPLSIAILVLIVFANSYYSLFDIAKEGTSSYKTLLSIPFMSLGVFYRHNKEKVKVTIPILAIIFLLGYIIGYSEFQLGASTFNIPIHKQNYVIGSYIMGISIFLIAVQLKIKDNRISRIGASYSFFIYLYHISLFTIYYTLLDMGSKLIGIQYALAPYICFALTLVIGIVIKKYFKKTFRYLIGEIYLIK